MVPHLHSNCYQENIGYVQLQHFQANYGIYISDPCYIPVTYVAMQDTACFTIFFISHKDEKRCNPQQWLRSKDCMTNTTLGQFCAFVDGRIFHLYTYENNYSFLNHKTSPIIKIF